MNEVPLHRLPLSFVSSLSPHPSLSPLPSLFTSAADGSIIFWRQYLDDLNLKSSQVLFGHSSPITALSLLSGEFNLISASSLAMATSASGRHAPTVDADGATSLHGPDPSPSMGQIPRPSSSSRRNLCVTTRAGQESTVLVVDSSTLTVARTLAHGGLGIGPVRSMILVGKDAILADGHGKILSLKLDKKSDQDSEFGGSHPPSVLEEGSSDGQCGSPSCPMEEKEVGAEKSF